ncbi:MAG TPA: nucleoside-diphosphate sugar epimerase/dehydratase [Candidatus Limnocylindria bacterium]|nr:nucleoside-diphosphate sugar epimerase/dehydratase [Candidatus Limnocylindria bacterium]
MKRPGFADARRAGVRALTLRGRHLVVLDVASTALSFLLALALRFDAPSPTFDAYLRVYLWALPVLVVARVGAFLWLRLYQRVWRYASVDELIAVLVAVVGSSIFAYAIVYAGYLEAAPPTVSFPRSVPVIDTILMIALAGSWRFAFRVVGVGRRGARTVAGLERALVVGSGTAALSVIRDLRTDVDLGMHPVGVLADDLPREQRLLGLPVLGRTEDLAGVVKDHNISVVLLALPSAEGRVLRRLVRSAEAAGARCLTVPSVAEVVAGRIRMDALREIDVEDLLRRAPARIDHDSVRESFRDRRILITGAGGSIGSELARQLSDFGPKQLILLGRGENSIFEALQTLERRRVDTVPVILDIRDGDRLHALFREMRPDVVFHAAAHKHVNFMEMYPEEAVATNILGTQNVIEASAEVAVERFVLISSDKAVNPTSVMGVTKRVSELLVADAARRTNTRFATVRFGNVLSSRGSVVPIFKRQLELGGPLTVTDPEVKRFFMTIPEAVQLVMQASVLAEPGDLFVLDMGDAVKIVDLANDLISLNGLEVGVDVTIEFTGLRPGEKLNEELLFPYERSEATSHEAVRRIVHGTEAPAALGGVIAELARLVALRQRAAIIQRMRDLVPEYSPSEVRR